MNTLVMKCSISVLESCSACGRGLAWLLVSIVLGVTLQSGCGGGQSTDTSVVSTPILPPVIRVIVTPNTPLVDQGASRQFLVSVTGTSNQAVTWSIQEGSAGGSISQTGLYTAPAIAMDAHVVATSVADPSKSAIALVTVNPVN
jgi:chitinase